MYWLHLALLKFLHLIGKTNLGGVINDSRCGDLENFCRTRPSDKRLPESALALALASRLYYKCTQHSIKTILTCQVHERKPVLKTDATDEKMELGKYITF